MKKLWLFLLAACLLTGCSSQSPDAENTESTAFAETEEYSSDSETAETVETESLSVSSEPSSETAEIQPETENPDPSEESARFPEAYEQTQKILENAEKDFAENEKRLETDSLLSQFDMNTISYDGYVVWDNALNEIWTILTQTLPPEEMETLTAEEDAWIQETDDAVAAATEETAGGSLSTLIANETYTELTQKRAYELAEKLNRQ